MIKQMLDKPETIVAFCALIVSIFSMIITICQLRIQRKHNIKSVKPIAKFDFGDYEDHLYAKIVNNGIGPLIIKNINFIKGSEKKDNLIEWLDCEDFNDFVSELRNKAITPNNEIILFSKKFDNSLADEELRKKIRTQLSQIKGELEYQDIYENSYIEKRKFSLFSRTLG